MNDGGDSLTCVVLLYAHVPIVPFDEQNIERKLCFANKYKSSVFIAAAGIDREVVITKLTSDTSTK